MIIDLGYTGAQGTGAGFATLVHIEDLIGSNFNDTLIGDGGGNRLDGGAGNDLLYGGNGNDFLSGGAGDDTLVGGAGTDALDGGSGSNTASYVDAASGVTVDLGYSGQNTGGGGYDNLVDIQNLTGSNYDDTLIGNGDGNALKGLDGNDLLLGGNGNDALDGGNGFDTADFITSPQGVIIDLGYAGPQGTGAGFASLVNIEALIGSNFNDTLIGNGGNNRLDGSAGNDILYGFNGNDTLVGGAGQDTLYGGAGSNTFVFSAITDSSVAFPDHIMDLQNASDTIDLSGIDAKTGVAGDQAFTLVANFTNTAGQAKLSYQAGAGVTWLDMDVNGDGVPDSRIVIEGGDHTAFIHFVL